jgi:hypothetical protein
MPSRHMEPRSPDMSRHYIGIDPGASGGIAWSSPLGDKSAPLPATLGDFREMLFNILVEQSFFDPTNDISQTICYLESPPKFVKAIPGSAVFVMAQSFGRIEGVLAAFKVPTVTITPQHWQKAHGLGTRGDMTTTQWKNKLKARAQSLYPEEKVTLATADALLIFNAGCHRLI